MTDEEKIVAKVLPSSTSLGVVKRVARELGERVRTLNKRELIAQAKRITNGGKS